MEERLDDNGSSKRGQMELASSQKNLCLLLTENPLWNFSMQHFMVLMIRQDTGSNLSWSPGPEV